MSRTIRLCIVALVMLFFMCVSFVYATEIPPGVYPSSFNKLGKDDWSVIKERIEKCVDSESFIRSHRIDGHDIISLCNRVADIDWSDGQRDEIGVCILESVEKMLSKVGYFDKVSYEPRTDTKNIPRSPVHDLLFAYGRVTNKLHSENLLRIWNLLLDKSNFSRSARTGLLEAIAWQIKSNEAIPLLEKLNVLSIEGTLSSYNGEIVKYVNNYHKYAVIDSERKAWLSFWDEVKPDPQKNIFVGNNYPFMLVLRKTGRFIKSRSDRSLIPFCDPKIPYEIALESKDTSRKYLFLMFSLCCCAEEAFYSPGTFIPNKAVPLEFLDQINLILNEIDRSIDEMKISDDKKFIDVNKKMSTGLYEFSKTKENMSRNAISSNNIVSSKAQIIRPEDQGEDFSLFDNAENFKRLTTAEDKFERWKAAKVLGTRFIDGKYKPTQDEQKKIDEYVAFLLTQYNTDNPGDAGDATDQLWRLWSLAIPGLLQGLKDKDRTTWNAALRHLVILRNENIVETLIKEYDKVEDEDYKRVLLDALGKMRTKYDNRFPYRKMMNSKKSAELADKLITPFLNRISATEKVERLQNAIKEAKTFIAEPVDSRSLYVDPTTGTEKPVVDEDLEDEQESNSQIPETPLEPSPQLSSPQPTTKSITRSTAIYFVLSFVLLLLVIIVALIYRRKR